MKMAALRSGGVAPRQLWHEVSREAFWDRNVAYEVWRSRVLEGHPSYLPQSVQRFKAEHFVQLLGKDEFVEHWPRLRKSLKPEGRRAWAYYDLVWSYLATETYNVKPLQDWFTLTRREREFLLAAAREPGRGIYETAKSLGMQYKRAFEYSKQLVQAGFLRILDVRRNGRRVSLLYPY